MPELFSRSSDFSSSPESENELDFAQQDNEQGRLEEQLAAVMEGASGDAPKPKKRTRSRRRGRAVTVAPTVIHNPEPIILTVTSSQVDDHAKHLDRALLERMKPKAPSNTMKRVEVRFGEHAPSPHLLEFGGLAAESDPEERLDEGGTIQSWMAPMIEGFDLDTLVSHIDDLHVAEIDPRFVNDQYTLGDADAAYAEQYRWWAKIRAPFVRWEPASLTRSDLVPERIFDVPDVVESFASSGADQTVVSDQFTDGTVASDWKERVGETMAQVIDRAELAVAGLRDKEQDMVAQVERSWNVPMLIPKLDFVRVMGGFVALMAIVALPAGAVSLSRSFGEHVSAAESQSRAALADVKRAVASPLSPSGSQAWQAATQNFQSASNQLNQANVLASALANALPQTRKMYQSAQALLSAGTKASQAAGLLNQGVQAAVSDPAMHADERIMAFQTRLDVAAPLIDDAITSISQVDASVLPEDVRDHFKDVQVQLSGSHDTLAALKALTNLAVAALGHESDRRYLIMFQNHTELRPTGGFMGSLADVTFDRGQLKNVTVPGGGPYDLQGQLTVREAPPKPLQLVSDRWEFQDANWYPDFPTSADQVKYFWSKAGQPTVDGVIAINATIMPKLLALTGPIEMPEYGKTITADNFLLETQKEVELEYDKTENKPKKFIGDLMPKLLAKLTSASSSEWPKYFAVLEEALATKEIQISMSRPDEQRVMEQLGWSGSFGSVPGDSLAIIEANIAGQKTDAMINEQVEHRVEVGEDGSLVDSVTLTRTHTGEKGAVFSGVNNVSYVRVYVPQGSELLSADGFNPPPEKLFKQVTPDETESEKLASVVGNERSGVNGVTITDEFGRTAFGGWLQLQPGQTSVTHFRYRLPFTMFDLERKLSPDASSAADRAAYSVLYTSQSGKPNRTLQTSIILPSSWKVAWTNADQQSGVLSKQQTWDRDQVVGALAEKGN